MDLNSDMEQPSSIDYIFERTLTVSHKQLAFVFLDMGNWKWIDFSLDTSLPGEDLKRSARQAESEKHDGVKYSIFD